MECPLVRLMELVRRLAVRITIVMAREHHCAVVPPSITSSDPVT